MNLRDFELLVKQVKDSPRFELVRLNVEDAASLVEQIKELQKPVCPSCYSASEVVTQCIACGQRINNA